MSKRNHDCGLQLDPRTKILLLLLSNFLLFLEGSTAVMLTYMSALAILLLLSKRYKVVVVFGAIFLLLAALNYFIFPIAPKAFTMMFSISVNYTFKMLPCLMAGAMLIMTTSLHEVVLAMRKYKVPQQLIIPISVTIRYFPAIFEEVKHINNAMKLRNVPVASKVECFIVPIMMAASTTVEELSAAAVTRGIENPAPKTSVRQLHFQISDYLVMIAGLTFVVASFVI